MQHVSSYIKGNLAKRLKKGGGGLLHDSEAHFYMHSGSAKPGRKLARYNNTYMYIFITVTYPLQK